MYPDETERITRRGRMGRKDSGDSSKSGDKHYHDHHFAEEASLEQYSGPASGSIPSSYSTLHHRRYSSRSRSRVGSSRRLSVAEDEDLGGSIDDMQQQLSTSVTSSHFKRPRADSRSSFRFFSQDEVERAEGASTASDFDPVEYEVFLRESDSAYLEEEDNGQDIYPSILPGRHGRYSFDGSNRVSIDAAPRVHPDIEDTGNYYSTEEPVEQHPDVHPHYRRRRRSSNFYDDATAVDEPLLGDETSNYDPHDLSKQIYTYPSKRCQQRFYVSEEDLVIFFAGYKTSRVRSTLYVLLCVCTLGMAYLVLHWFPRWRVSCIGVPSPFGECDWLVIENQWGELAIVDVDYVRYCRPLSTVFRQPKDEKAEPPDDSAASSNVGGTSEDEHEYVDTDPILHTLRWFEYRYIKFLYNPTEDIFQTNQDWVDQAWEVLDPLPVVRNGIDSGHQEDRHLVFGSNDIEIREKPTTQLLIEEALHPFYVFQVFSIILWFMDDYYFYASCIFFISLISVVNTLVETKQTIRRLREVSKMECEVRVMRNGFWTTVSSTELVPGDVFEVSDPAVSVLPCDSILLTGDCIVNESMLTGESVPVTKLPATDETFAKLTSHSGDSNVAPEVAKHFLYSGTKIIRVRRPTRDDINGEDVDMDEDDAYDVALAVVVRTGFSTTKGALVRSMMFPKPSGFKFYQDSFKYIGVMGMIAVFGFIISTINFIKLGMPTHLIVLRALDLITIVVPPALPATLSIGTNISLARLKGKSIFCISPNRVNVGGKLDAVCFDKTGTLTEDGLDVLGVRIVEKDHCQLSGLISELVEEEDYSSEIEPALATCHSLRQVDNELIGDPLDFKMFEFTKWRFEEEHGGVRRGIVRCSYSNDDRELELETMKSFEFVSQLRRMSVLVRDRSDASNIRVYVKGAPEVMKGICLPESVPSDYYDQLHYYTHRGYRVIACATKVYESTSADEVAGFSRAEVESDLKLIGFIIFENKLKEHTTATIRELRNAKIRTVMCTGDNVLTAISVGRECHIVKYDEPVYVPYFVEEGDVNPDQPVLQWENIETSEKKLDPRSLVPLDRSEASDYVLAVTGEAFSYILRFGTSSQVEQMLTRGAIFARMSPDEKHELVEKLQEIDYTTGFCGDGANDCGALKAADVGISLSEAEASVAAPFTSRIFEISCVLDVIREGRCALATSFSCFKYMSMYSAIQFCTVSILYSLGSNLGDFQFLWIDLFLILPIAIFMAWAKPYEKLSKKRPTANLVSRKVLLPLISEIVIFSAFQFLIWGLVRTQPWYSPPVLGGEDDELTSSDNSALFIFSCFQYIFIAVILSVGPPYRQPMYKNLPFLGTIAFTTGFTLAIMFLVPADSGFGRYIQISYMSLDFKFILAVMTLFNFLASYFAELYVFPQLMTVFVALKRVFGLAKKHSHKRYKNLLNQDLVDV
ncbi:vacuolar cation-transporting ATPase Ypk9p [Trichomonascus vanleenenianus]|uniref:putative acid anhydride hydrolase n=1 Tax=Trichomonascus vanleenenianus TaxID=2268995 RepID=UPI003ECB353C